MAKKVTEKKAVAKKAAPKKEVKKLDPNKVYDFKVTKESKHMKVGTYTVDGVMAQILLDKGLGTC